MARISEEQKEATRLSLMESAADHFARVGFERADINAIAKSAGFGKGTIYNYFKSKAELFSAILEEACRRIAAEFKTTRPPNGDLKQNLMALAEADCNAMAAHPGFSKVLIREAMSFRPETFALIQKNMAPFVAVFAGIIAGAVAEGEIDQPLMAPEQLGLVFDGIITMLCIQHWGVGLPALDDIPQLAVELFLNGALSARLSGEEGSGPAI